MHKTREDFLDNITLTVDRNMAGSGTRNLNEQCQPNYRFQVIDTDYNPTMKTQMHRFLRVSLKSNFGHYSYSNYRKPRGFQPLVRI